MEVQPRNGGLRQESAQLDKLTRRSAPVNVIRPLDFDAKILRSGENCWSRLSYRRSFHCSYNWFWLRTFQEIPALVFRVNEITQELLSLENEYIQRNPLNWDIRLLWANLILKMPFHVLRVKMHRLIGRRFPKNKGKNTSGSPCKLSCCRQFDLISSSEQ